MEIPVKFNDLQIQNQRIKTAVQNRWAKIMENSQYILGPEVKELEIALSRYVGISHCIAVANGTDAIQLALMALDVKPGDEIITSPFSFAAAVEVISLLGAKAVFVDIDPDTFQMDPDKIENQISKKTKAILPISLFGQCADINRIQKIADKHLLPVLEDGAQSFGATHFGKKSCGMTVISTTSFFPSKPLGCYGDGGAVFTSDPDLAYRIFWMRAHGQNQRYHHQLVGLNSRLDTIQAAVLLEKLKIFNEEILAREKIAKRYSQLLEGHVKLPLIANGNTSVYAQYTIQVERREDVITKLQNQNIPTAVHYPSPLHLQPAFSNMGYKTGNFPVAERICHKVLSLPMHPYLSIEDQDQVVAAICS